MIDRRDFVGGAAGLLAALSSGPARGARGGISSEFSYSTLHTFEEYVHHRPGPMHIMSPVCQASDGAFYGTSIVGGANDAGAVYRMKADGTVKILHDFEAAGWIDYLHPRPALIQATDGKLYSTHRHNGEFGAGIVYSVDRHGRFEIVHSFESGQAGTGPMSPLIQASDGYFYGTTYEGGVANQGTVFRLKPGGGFKVLHSFRGIPHPAHPIGGLLEARDGFLYGTTYHGGYDPGQTYGLGTVFKMDLDGVIVALHKMQLETRGPAASLIQTRDGEIFGTARLGGQSLTGSVFKLTEKGRVQCLHVFENDLEGELPNGILEASDGALYITNAIDAGIDTPGAVLRMSRDGQVELVHVFDHREGGTQPVATLIEDDAGRLVGTTRYSGHLGGHGTVFALTRT